MDNERKNPLEDVLQDLPEFELGPDELAVHTAGLTHPDDLELEKILAEDWDSVPDQDFPAMTAEEALNQFLYGEEDEPAPEQAEEEVMPAEADATQVISMDEELPAVQEYEETEEVLYADEEEAFEEEEYEESGEEEAEEAGPEKPLHKRRPKFKKGAGLFGIPHIISTAIWLALIVAIGVSLGRVLWVCCADVMSFGKPQVTAYISVTLDDDIDSVAQKMADANLIRYPNLFVKFAEITKKHDKLQIGVHELGSHLDYNAMINNMVYTSYAREEVEIVFPEGYNCAQMFKILEENGVCNVVDLETWAAEGELKEYWFLEGVERGDKYCLEGYMAPDTYRFYTNDHPQNVLQKFLDEFDDRFTDIMKENLITMQERYANLLANRGYGSDYIAEHPLTLQQVLTVASVIERETATDLESFDIASVLYNRVTNPNIGTMGSDATVYYAVGDFLREKTELTQADLESDSPYNTRKATGIPPGPICNPGAYALYAALDPNDTNYHYFVYDRDNNQHLFSETHDEHLRKVNELGV